MAPSTFDVQSARAQFPALSQKQVYFDNAGGSQVLKTVIDSISAYLSSNNVQLGASYRVARESTRLFEAGSAAVAKYINADPSEVVLGPSTTQLFRNLSLALYDYLGPGDEIVISKLDHEANIASWIQLAQWRGCKVVWWEGEDLSSTSAPSSNKDSSTKKATNPHLTPASLLPLLTPKTKFVTATHTSNILGTITDIRALSDAIHNSPSGSNALLCVDAVAYAPHRAIDVQSFGADIYCFSWYKLYGPHMASMYVSRAAQDKALGTLGHFFKPTATLENKLGLAAANYELTASIPEVCAYLARTPWEAIAAHEEVLQGILIEYLNSKPDAFTIYGESVADKARRVPVVSFTVKGRESKGVVDAIEERSDFACRWGAFYSNRLCEEVLGLDAVDGVVRVSLLHYNTEEEIREYVKVLNEVVFS